MNTQGLFVTGTDTDVGKSFACGFLAALLTRLGKKALYYKPIQCGPVEYDHHSLPGGDALLVKTVLGHPHTLCTYALNTPVSPHRAFAIQKEHFDIFKYQDTLVSNRKDYQFIVVEGAGGIRVPVTDKLEMTDLAKASSFPVLVVARPGLGTLNHTLLTLEHLQQKHLPVAGFVFSTPLGPVGESIESDSLAVDNYETIQVRSGVPFLGFIPLWKGRWSKESLDKHPMRHYFERLSASKF